MTWFLVGALILAAMPETATAAPVLEAGSADSLEISDAEAPPSRFIQKISWTGYARYNRVETPFLGPSYTLTPVAFPTYTLTAKAGYGFGMDRVRYVAQLQRLWGDFEEWDAVAAFGDETWANEMALVSGVENLAGSLLFRRDFRDYYRRRGGIFQLSRTLADQFTFQGSVSVYQYASLAKETDWSLFGMGERRFRLNPAVGQGTEARVSVAFEWDSRLSVFFPSNDWVVRFQYDRAFRDFDYNQVKLAIHRYQRVTSRQRLVLRGQLASFDNVTEERVLYDLGGVGTLRGFPYKRFTGNRMLMFNLDYLFGGSVLQRLPLHWIPMYRGTGLVLFADTGIVRFTDPANGLLDGFKGSQNFRTDIGFGFSVAQELLRVDIARRLDQGAKNWAVTLRLSNKL